MKMPKKESPLRIIFLWLKRKSIDPDQILVSTASMIILCSFLLMSPGCRYYKISTTSDFEPGDILVEMLKNEYPEKKYPRESNPDEVLVEKLFQQRILYVIDSSGRWLLENPHLVNDTIFGKITYSPGLPDSVKSCETRKSKRYQASTESDIIKRINLYITALNVNDSAMNYIPLSYIYKYDIYEQNKGKRTGNILISIGGGILVGFAVLVVIALSQLSNMSIYK